MRRALVAACAAACGHPPAHDPGGHGERHHMASEAPGLGAHLAISCGADAQASFDQGFSFLHNMDYARAHDSFARAIAAHAECAMLHWGDAMTYFHPLWAGQPTADAMRSGAAAVANARAGQATASERDYIAAVGAFYDDWEHADYATRIARWDAAQKQLAEHHADDIEAQAFAALAALATIDKQDKQKAYDQQLAIGERLEQLLQQRPQHPGLMHYLLHAYDNPALAQHAIEIARKYAETSPGAAHALHMPSHIYTRLGDWQGVVASNLQSAHAALQHPSDGGRVSRDFLHATDYLIYGYLQMGDDDHAREALSKIDPTTPYELTSGPVAYALSAVPARFALERGAWKDAAALEPRKVPYDWERYPWAEAVTYAARGLGAARSGDAAGALAALIELERLKSLIESKWWQGRVQIEEDVITGWLHYVRGDPVAAEARLRHAAESELAASKDNVEPGHVVVAIEQLGDLLLELKRPQDALEAYKSALADTPHRFHALFGAGQAAELAGLVDQAKTYYRDLVAISPASKRLERTHAQAFLQQHP
jgi:tetratricopeptide (TPR) repeat protein